MTKTTCTLAALVLAASSVAAETAKERGDALFYEGKANMARKQYDAACTAFQQSHELDPAPVKLLQLSECREANGQLASAHDALEALAALVANQRDANAGTFRTVATQRLAKLGPRRSKIIIQIPADSRVAELEIFRNATRVEDASWNRELFLDGGSYDIAARAPGHREWMTKVTVRPESDRQVVEIPRLTVNPSPIKVEPPIKRDPVPVTTEPAKAEPVKDPISIETPTTPTTTTSSSKSPLRWVAAGGAVVFAGAAIGLDLSARSTYKDSLAEPNRDRQLDLWHSANTRRYVATGFAVAGLASAGLATYLFVRSPSERRVAIAPTATPDSVGVTISGLLR